MAGTDSFGGNILCMYLVTPVIVLGRSLFLFRVIAFDQRLFHGLMVMFFYFKILSVFLPKFGV